MREESFHRVGEMSFYESSTGEIEWITAASRSSPHLYDE